MVTRSRLKRNGSSRSQPSRLPKWKNTLNISDLLRAYESKKITLDALGKGVASRLRKLKMFDAEDTDSMVQHKLDEIAQAFEIVESDNEFNETLNDLYDIADRDKLLWINTMGGQFG